MDSSCRLAAGSTRFCAGILSTARHLTIEQKMADYSNKLYHQLEQETGIQTGKWVICLSPVCCPQMPLLSTASGPTQICLVVTSSDLSCSLGSVSRILFRTHHSSDTKVFLGHFVSVSLTGAQEAAALEEVKELKFRCAIVKTWFDPVDFTNCC